MISNDTGVGIRRYMIGITIGETLGSITKYNRVDSIYIFGQIIPSPEVTLGVCIFYPDIIFVILIVK
jgi:hypothetical protein